MSCTWSVIGVAAALILSCGVATAEPVAPQADSPQPGAPCTGDLDGAMTLPTGQKVPLACTGGSWAPVADPYPISEKWASFGPAMTLHGQGRPNPNLLSGAWTATPLDTQSSCSATQVAVIPGSPTTGAPRVDRAPAGQHLTFDVVPVLFTIDMNGDCLWQRSR